MNTAVQTISDKVSETAVYNFGETHSGIHLELDVTDRESVKEIIGKQPGRERTEYALNALTVGLLSLRHARGQVDAHTVRREGDRILSEMGNSLETYRTQMTSGLTSVLQEYFDPSNGRFQERVERLIRKDGELEQVLRRQVGADGSELAAAMAAHVGKNSPIMTVLDPEQSGGVVAAIRTSAEQVLQAEAERILKEFSLDNKNGAMSRMISELVDKNGHFTGDLTKRIDEVVKEFSLDSEDSALSRLVRKVENAQKTISSEFSLDNAGSALARMKKELVGILDEQNKQNVDFQRDVTSALEAMKARREESLRSTRHGNDFEEAVVDFVTHQANKAGDIASATGSTTGLIKNNKVGDAVIELGPECVAAGAKFVIEAKEASNCDVERARTEIDTARKNRGATVGVFVFSKKTAPENIESIFRIANDVFVVWDAEDIGADVILKTALSLAKAMCVRESSRRTAEAAEFGSIDKAILAIEKEAQRLDEMRRLTETIKNNSDKVLDSVRKMADGLQTQVANLRDAVDGLNPSIT